MGYTLIVSFRQYDNEYRCTLRLSYLANEFTLVICLYFRNLDSTEFPSDYFESFLREWVRNWDALLPWTIQHFTASLQEPPLNSPYWPNLKLGMSSKFTSSNQRTVLSDFDLETRNCVLDSYLIYNWDRVCLQHAILCFRIEPNCRVSYSQSSAVLLNSTEFLRNAEECIRLRQQEWAQVSF
jgi:hypothetical protein